MTAWQFYPWLIASEKVAITLRLSQVNEAITAKYSLARPIFCFSPDVHSLPDTID